MIRRIILAVIANSVALYLVDYFLGNLCLVSTTVTSCPAKPETNILIFVLAGIVLGLLNTFVKPILKLISMPITFLTAGLFMFVVNGIVFGLLVWLVNTLDLETVKIFVFGSNVWLTYIYAAVILGIFNILTHWLVRR
ncbi:phage holin family protein [Candidatus Gracilibacteria bacterium]|nr:phage holin family protein [Candidatus Gracilibacteria bacterium]MCF7856271.1 phage holin family protein [Candidatus Gracilibacteria bacterium]MCF7896250.1 phage holin family protein [Candidatus Gracilibacteria bacterium]